MIIMDEIRTGPNGIELVWFYLVRSVIWTPEPEFRFKIKWPGPWFKSGWSLVLTWIFDRTDPDSSKNCVLWTGPITDHRLSHCSYVWSFHFHNFDLFWPINLDLGSAKDGNNLSKSRRHGLLSYCFRFVSFCVQIKFPCRV